jgi:hypothetical protein
MSPLPPIYPLDYRNSPRNLPLYLAPTRRNFRNTAWSSAGSIATLTGSAIAVTSSAQNASETRLSGATHNPTQ